ncbi:MAG: flagellar basal body rod protein FlgC [Alphaproteobacteria bacterium]
MINTISIALSGLNAATQKLNASASNVANVTTAGSLEDGGKAPYDALTTQQKAQENGGVRSDVVSSGRPFVPAYDPDSPFANAEGIIGAPNVDLAEEAVTMNLAEMTYKANIATLKTAEEMSDELLNIFDDDA